MNFSGRSGSNRMTISFLKKLRQNKDIKIKLQSLKCNLFLYHQLPEVDEPVTHTPKSCVDATVGCGCNFFKAHIGIMSQDNHFTLVFRKSFQHFTNAVMALSFDHDCLCTVFCKIQDFKNVLVLAVTDSGSPLYFPEMVYTQVMCDTHSPWQKFSLFCIVADTLGVY